MFGRKTVLVVEDHEDVRRVVAAQLDSLGYRVLEAEDGVSALAVLNSNASIDLLLTDTVMLGKPQGPALAEQARIIHPDLRVILMTGYPSDVAVAGNAGTPSLVRLTKPISKGELAREIWKQFNDGLSERKPTRSGDCG